MPPVSAPEGVAGAAYGRQTSVMAGTIFHDSRTPLTTWFRAMWWLTNQRERASRPWPAVHVGLAQLQDRRGLAPQTAARDGAARARPSDLAV